MDYSTAGVRQPGHRLVKKTKQPRAQPSNMYPPYGQPVQNPPLFEDTSNQPPPPPPPYGPPSGYPPPNSNIGYDINAFPGQQLLTDPVMASMAMNYGQALVGQGKDLVDKKLEKYISVSKLKYYFAVDTNYVLNKLRLIFFPFSHADWSIKYNQDEPVPPRYEINAPDLYIPVMAFVTYILVAGYLLGTQNRFSPEVLGMQASSALVWLIIEILAIVITIYVTRLESRIRTLDLVAFCCYKYVGMIASLLGSLFFTTFGYYVVLCYSSISIAFFLVRALKLQLFTERENDVYGSGTKRRLYLLLFIAVVQPILMYWLTHHIISVPAATSESR